MRKILAACVGALALAGCASIPMISGSAGEQQTTQTAPSKVEIVQTPAGEFELQVDGVPFRIRGAGIGQPSDSRFADLVAAGGNTVRTWSAGDADQVLALAEKHGVMVAMGIDFGQELHGFNYDDPEAVAAQFARVKEQIDRYKDHPNLLLWIVGNELNLLYGEHGIVLVNPKVYSALNDVVQYIHDTDPNHPVSTAFAGYLADHVGHAMPFAPDLDFLAVQMYGDVVRMPEFMAADPSKLPVMLTEYGPLGHWEMPSTAWGREIEEPSGVKAEGLASRIDQYIVNEETGRLIGDFVFYWGHKQERTSTWYSLFTKEGQSDARVDELTRYWTGEYPSNRAPLTMGIDINGVDPARSISLKPSQIVTANIDVTEPDGDAMTTAWTLRREVAERSQGGEYEAVPSAEPIVVIKQSTDSLTFEAPKEAGEYRLFSVTSDPDGKIGTANAPFMVR